VLSSADAHLVRSDPALPGLAVLLDPDRFAQTLRDLSPQVQIDSVQNTYVRYKPGINCLAVYQVQSAGTVANVYATVQGIGASDKLHKSSRIPQVPGALGLGVVVLEDLSMVVSCLPNDRKLRAVKRLADHESRRNLLRHTVPDRGDLWESGLRELRYKPRRRYVAQLVVDEQPKAALKVYTKSSYGIALGKIQLFASQTAFRTAPLLGHCDRHNLVVFEWLPGDRLFEMILNTGDDLRGIGQVGASLGHLHSLTLNHLPVVTREAEVARLLEAASELGVVCPHLHQDAQRLARQIADRLVQEPGISRTIHGDFYAKQVLLDRNEPAFVDLDEAAIGDPASDLGRFTAHLEYVAVCGDLAASRVERVSAELLEGHHSTIRHDPSPRLPLYQAAELLHLTTQPFRYRHRDWPDRAEAVLQRTQQIFNTVRTNNPRPQAQCDQPRDCGDVSVSDPFGVTDDPAMHFLADALDPLTVQSRLQRLALNRPGLTEKVDLRAIRVTRHKPGRRCLIEYDLIATLHGGVEKKITWVGKARARGLDRTTYDLVLSLWKNGFRDDSDDGVSVPEPIGVIPEFNMWLQHKVHGNRVTDLLPQPGGIELARQLADAIHKLHLAGRGISIRRRHTIADELRILHERLGIVSQEQPHLATRLSRILAACDELGQTLTTPTTTGIHRDFYADQVISSGSRLFLIDFDLYCEGDPALDVGNFIGHLTEQSVRTSGYPNTLADREWAMADRFVELAGQDAWYGVQVYVTLTLVRHIYLSTRFEDRKPFTECLIRLCEDRLEGAGASPNGIACHDTNEATG